MYQYGSHSIYACMLVGRTARASKGMGGVPLVDKRFSVYVRASGPFVFNVSISMKI